MALPGKEFIGSDVLGTLAGEIEAPFVTFVSPDGRVITPMDEDGQRMVMEVINSSNCVTACPEWRFHTIEGKTPSVWTGNGQSMQGIRCLYEQLFKAGLKHRYNMIPVAWLPGSHLAGIPADEGYELLKNRKPQVLEAANAFSLHVHFGVKELTDRGIRVLKMMDMLSPLLAAISANSYDTECGYSYHSMRLQRWLSFQLVRFIPPEVQDVKSFLEKMEYALKHKVAQQWTRLWFFNRFSIYTAESRICDLPGLPSEAQTLTATIASLFHAFFVEGVNLDVPEDDFKHDEKLRVNIGIATLGLQNMDAHFYNPFNRGKEGCLGDALEGLIRFVAPFMNELQYQPQHAALIQQVKNQENGAMRMMRDFQAGRNPYMEAHNRLAAELGL
ncbi:MAG: glutamate-cysteine ligase family protein [Patescibacteria group bacterium]